MTAQRRRRWAGIVQMLHRYFAFTGLPLFSFRHTGFAYAHIYNSQKYNIILRHSVHILFILA